MPSNKDFSVESARVGFKNFAGKEDNYNRKGDRNFCIFLDSDVAGQLSEGGWNIKWLDPREEGDEAQAYIQVAVSYKNKPPKVLLVSSTGKTVLSEAEVEMLDWADINNWDIVVTPYDWEVNGKTGRKAYLKALYATLEEDAFSAKYSM